MTGAARPTRTLGRFAPPLGISLVTAVVTLLLYPRREAPRREAIPTHPSGLETRLWQYIPAKPPGEKGKNL